MQDIQRSKNKIQHNFKRQRNQQTRLRYNTDVRTIKQEIENN